MGLDKSKCPDSLESWQGLLELIELTYTQADEDRYLLERSIEISSIEMNERIEKNKEMSLQLAQASKLSSLGTLSSGIAHELNNPLMGLMGHLDMLKKRQESEEKKNERYARCLKLINRMCSIVAHLRDLSRTSKEEDLKSIDVALPIADSFDLLGKQLTYENIKFIIPANKTPIHIMADKNKIESIIQNLILNSFHAFENHRHIENKTIELVTKEDSEKNKCIISYSDNAGGMPDEVLKNVFDPFFTTKDVGVGTGLGMSIAQQIIREHGGNIVCTTKFGEGTKFIIELPLAAHGESKNQSLAQMPAISLPKITTLDKRILFVEDEEDICEIYSSILADLFKVDAFTDPIAAKESLSTQQYDLLLTDIKMPKLNGIDLAKIARSINPTIELVFISGDADGKTKKELESFKTFYFLDKPLKDNKVLHRLIRRILIDKN